MTMHHWWTEFSADKEPPGCVFCYVRYLFFRILCHTQMIQWRLYKYGCCPCCKSLISTTFAVLFKSTAFSVHPIIFICQQPQQNRTGFLLRNRPTTLHNCKSCNSNPTQREKKMKVRWNTAWSLPKVTEKNWIYYQLDGVTAFDAKQIHI